MGRASILARANFGYRAGGCKGSGPGWFLDWVKVTNMASNRTWNFPCGRWLSKDEDDGKIERVLKAQ